MIRISRFEKAIWVSTIMLFIAIMSGFFGDVSGFWPYTILIAIMVLVSILIADKTAGFKIYAVRVGWGIFFWLPMLLTRLVSDKSAFMWWWWLWPLMVLIFISSIIFELEKLLPKVQDLAKLAKKKFPKEKRADETEVASPSV